MAKKQTAKAVGEIGAQMLTDFRKQTLASHDLARKYLLVAAKWSREKYGPVEVTPELQKEMLAHAVATWEKEIHAAFKMVQNKKHWKNPINAVLTPVPSDEMLALIQEAVIHFTGSVPQVEIKGNKARITAAGYYMTIGS